MGKQMIKAWYLRACLTVALLAPLLHGVLCQSQTAETKPQPPSQTNTATLSTNVVETPKLTGAEALRKLLDGNERFVSGNANHPDQSGERRISLAKGQSPFAIVLTCADSRVSPELFFDQGLGDLFVIRNAGNVLDDHVIGSMEYAVEHLHVPLIVVVGHEKCGAVSAAVAGGDVPGHLRSLVESIQPSVDATKDLPGDKVDNAVRDNARRVASILNHVEPVLKQAVADGSLTIVAARYDLTSGKIEILEPSKN
jgi:carbonic anhydrase